MKLIRCILFLFIALLRVNISSAQCTSCDITISSVSTEDYIVPLGKQLCITSTGKVYGTITLDGGTVCNQGIIKSSGLIVNDGYIDNYGNIILSNSLELKNNSYLNNYNNGSIEIAQNFFVHPNATYTSDPEAKLIVAHFETLPLMVNAGDNQTICTSSSATLGGKSPAANGMPPYTYSWAPATGLNYTNVANPVAKPTSNTTYTLTVTDDYGVTKTSTVTINVTASPTANAGNPQTICKGTTVTLGGSPAASGGAAPYKYTWAFYQGLNNDSIANPTATPNYTTTYVLSVVDNNKCYGTSSVVITVKPELVLFAGNDTTILKSDTARLGGYPTAYGTAPFTYSWSPTTGLNSSTIANPKATPSSNTTYVLTVTDAGSCGSKKDTVVVSVDVNQKVYAGADVQICATDTVKLGGAPTSKGGTLPYTYSWSPSTGLTGTSIANPKAAPSTTTSYTLTVTDAASHVRKDTVVVTVKSKPVANAGSDVTGSTPIVTLGATPAATGGKPPYRYNWSPANLITSPNVANPSVRLKDTTTFTLLVTDSNKCVSVDQVVYNYKNIQGSSCNLDSCTYTVSTTTSTNYTIGSGQKLCILPGGKVTGTITLNSGGKICNSGSFEPGSFVFNGGTLTNNSEGNAKITGNLILVSGAGLINDGYCQVTGYFKANSGANVLNNGSLKTSGRMLVQNTNFSNPGVITLNTTSLVITGSGTVTNDGTMMGIDTVKNSSTLKMGNKAIIFTKHFYNYSGAVTKKITTPSTTSGSIVVCTRTENAGQINDSIDICDQSPSAGPVFLDLNTGTIQSAVTYCKNSSKINGLSEVCGTCATIAITNNGCAGDMATFKANSVKNFDNYEFFKNSVSIQAGPDKILRLTSPAVAGDTIKVKGYSSTSPCKVVTSSAYVIQTKPTISISGSTVATGASVTLTASGAHIYKWKKADATELGTSAAVTVYPYITTTYVVEGTDTVKRCTGTNTVEVLKPLQINYTIQNPSFASSSPNSGSITLNVSGGKLPFTYAWSNSSTLATLSPATPNTTYSVTVTDANSQTATTSITVGYAAAWGSTPGVAVSGSTISKTIAGDAWGTAGTTSATIIGSGQNGWVEFTISSLTNEYSVGLGSTNNHGDYTPIEYAYKIGSGGGIYEGGVAKVYFSGGTLPKLGDVYRIERIGSAINYKKNGTVLYSSTANTALNLKANTAIFNSGGSISGIQGGFTDFPVTEYHNVNIDVATPTFPVCNGDANRNFTQTIHYDETGTVVKEEKSYVDYLGRKIQTQARDLSDNDVLASQIIYDPFGRMVLHTIAAPINQNDLCYKENFITNSNGASYSNADFNVPNYTKSQLITWPGEVDRPNGVGNTTPNTLGWYYSNNNTVEAFVPTTSFPYKRTEYDDNNAGAVKRTTMSGDAFSMGNGHEYKIYQLTTLNELDYLYGKDKCWLVEDYTDANYDGQGTITPAALSTDYRVFKTISIDQNGQEFISFTDIGGNILATGYSGQVNGANVNVMALNRTISNATFADVHLPAGCESSLVLNNGGSYNILNLATGMYVKFSNSIQFTGTTPNLPAGFYRITALNGQALSITQNVNYYHFSINYYDKAGRLKLTVPPEGVDIGYVPSATPPVHKMFSSIDFNSVGQVQARAMPDESITMYLYRKDGKLRFSQDARQRASHSNAGLRKFSYINYDELGRIVETGECNPLLAGSPVYYFDKLLPGTTAPGAGYTAVSTILEATSPSAAPIGGSTQQNFSVYDVPTSPPSPYVQANLKGAISMSWNDSKTSWFSYDELGRISWCVQQLQNMPSAGTNTVKTIDYKYDLLGNVTEVAYQKEVSAERFYHYYEYDADKRLKKVFTSTDAGVTKQELANYNYYRHGPLKRAELASKTQGIDYVYTINGWLKSINHPELTSQKDPGKDGLTGGSGNCPTDLFGMTLDYFSGDYTRANTLVQTYETPWSIGGPIGPTYAKNLYTGIIKAQRWKTVLPAASTGVSYSSNQLMYAYLYDNKYQLTTATFGTITSPGSLNDIVYLPDDGQSEQLPPRYRGPVLSVVDDYKVSAITYDKNGNIKTLNRNAFTAGSGGLTMDQLTYNYNLDGNNRLINNKLRNVTDAVSTTAYSTDVNFSPGQVSTSDNYVYDKTGQQIEDNDPINKEFTDYDVYGKVTAIYSNAAKTTLKARFTYDGNGFRIKKSDASGKNTWYVRDANGRIISVYEKAAGGSIVQTVSLYAAKRVGVHNIDLNTDEYELTDHTDNVRATFNTTLTNQIKTYFDKEYKDDYLFAYNSTLDNTQNHATSPAAKTVAVKLNSTNSYGPLFHNSIPIKNGQTISGSYWYKSSGTTTPGAMFVFAIDDLITKQNIGWQAFPCPSGSSSSWTEVTFNYTANNDGVLSIYPWNNDATQTVWFDDLTLSFGTGAGVPIASSKSFSDYYPHGSVIPGRNYASLSSTSYRYGYQGQHAERDAETNKNSFELRQWSGLLGRWSSKDPKHQFHSPYIGMGNNPVSGVDPDGGYVGLNPPCLDLPRLQKRELDIARAQQQYEFGVMSGQYGEVAKIDLMERQRARDFEYNYMKNWILNMTLAGHGPAQDRDYSSQVSFGSKVLFTFAAIALPAASLVGELGMGAAAVSSGGRGAFIASNAGRAVAAESGGGALAVAEGGGVAGRGAIAASETAGGSIVEEGGAFANSTATTSGSHYSVAYEMKLGNNMYPGKGYYTHFKAANISLNEAISTDAVFSKSMSDLGISIPRSPTGNILGESPSNWVWHHDTQPGIMQLVPKSQHTGGSIFWDTMHPNPNGAGGMSIWGK